MNANFYLIILFLVSSCNNNSIRRSTSLEKKVTIQGILVEEPPSYPDCGILSVKVAFKFQKLGTSEKFILLIPCPDFFGRDLFKKGMKYEAIFEKDTAFKFDETINYFNDDSLPIFSIS